MTQVSTATPTAASAESPILGEYLTIAEAARLVHCKSWPLYEAVKAGELRAFQPGGEGNRFLIRPTDLEQYVVASEVKAAQA